MRPRPRAPRLLPMQRSRTEGFALVERTSESAIRRSSALPLAATARNGNSIREVWDNPNHELHQFPQGCRVVVQ